MVDKQSKSGRLSINGKDIDIHNDYEIGAIYVKSEIMLNIQFKTI